LQLFDDGHVQNIALVISYYFKSTSREIYDALIPQLRARGQRVLAMRNHSKIILARMNDGSCYVFRGSPNLRSSVNVEVLTATQCPHLYDFHHRWIHQLLTEGKELGKA
jgi:transketolase